MTTSWNKIGKWYEGAVGEEGHFYHRTLILPNSLKLLAFKETPSPALLDLACGQGVLSRQLPSNVAYFGVDLAESLIKAARQHNKNPNYQFALGDVTKPLPTNKKDFSHAAILLALQNIEDPSKVFLQAHEHLIKGGKFLIVLNHPCYRIPRQSSWKIDEGSKIQYRRVDRYMNAMKIPIQTHPGKGEKSPHSWSFHHPLSAYSQWLHEAGFTIDLIEEWCSNKVSEGKAAKMENRSREEIPLFMAILAVKK